MKFITPRSLPVCFISHGAPTQLPNRWCYRSDARRSRPYSGPKGIYKKMSKKRSRDGLFRRRRHPPAEVSSAVPNPVPLAIDSVINAKSRSPTRNWDDSLYACPSVLAHRVTWGVRPASWGSTLPPPLRTLIEQGVFSARYHQTANQHEQTT